MKIRSKAPLRISFAGGGTDVPPYPEREGGCVLNATVNKYAFGSLQLRNDNMLHIESIDYGVYLEHELNNEFVFDGKLDLVKAAIMKLQPSDTNGFNLFLHTDVPPGSGLGSSSAMMVCLVGLLKELRNLPLSDYELANIAYTIERKELGIKGGLQDQYASTFGGFNFIEFYRDRVIVNPLRISQDCINELEHNLLLCYTGKTRISDNIIEDQTRRYENGIEETLDALRKQKELAIELKNTLLQRRLHDFGYLLDQAWNYKKKMSNKISSPYIDALYEEAKKKGALGGKITGAGGGGYMLFYCPFEFKHKVAEAIKKMGASIIDFGFEFYGLQTWRVSYE